MDERCEGRKCLREVNPEQFPGVYWGTPGDYDPDCGCCNDCQPPFISESAPIEKRVWDNLKPKVNIEGTQTGRITHVMSNIKELPRYYFKVRKKIEFPAREVGIPIKKRQLITLDSKIQKLEEEITKLEKQIQMEGGTDERLETV